MCSKESQAKRSEYKINSNNSRNRRKFVKPSERSSGSEATLSERRRWKMEKKLWSWGQVVRVEEKPAPMKWRLWSLFERSCTEEKIREDTILDYLSATANLSSSASSGGDRVYTASEFSLQLINIHRCPVAVAVVSSSDKRYPSGRRLRRRWSPPQPAPAYSSAGKTWIPGIKSEPLVDCHQ